MQNVVVQHEKADDETGKDKGKTGCHDAGVAAGTTFARPVALRILLWAANGVVWPHGGFARECCCLHEVGRDI